MAELVTIPISIFDLTVRYEKISIQLLAERADIVQALFDSFAEFQPNPDDLEVITTGTTSEKGIRFRIASQRITLFFGAVYCKFTKEAALWADADKILRILDTFLTILNKLSGVAFGKKISVLSLHLQPKTVSYKDILRPFIDSGIKKLDPAPLDAMAIIARWPRHRITLDGSAQLANGIFVQIEREFDATLSYDDMRQNIFHDEVEVFKLLGVEEVEA